MNSPLVAPELIIGTANFGNRYGIANQQNISNSENESNIIKTAIDLGILCFDSASGYGSSESILGNNLINQNQTKITSKVGIDDCRSASELVQTVQKSLRDTKVTKFRSVLLHNSSELVHGNAKEIRNGLRQLIEMELCERIGVSVYNEQEALEAKRILPELTEFQIPENICDQRKLPSRALLELSYEGNYLSVRSVFLQGLLLMNPDKVPMNLEPAKRTLVKLKSFADSIQLTILESCMAYAKSIPWASAIIVGVNNPEQLEAIASIYQKSYDYDFNAAPRLDEWILDPRNWS